MAPPFHPTPAQRHEQRPLLNILAAAPRPPLWPNAESRAGVSSPARNRCVPALDKRVITARVPATKRGPPSFPTASRHPSAHAAPEPNAPSGVRGSGASRTPAQLLPRSPAEKHPPLPASIPRVPEMPEVGRRNGAPRRLPSVPRPRGHCAPRGHQGARGRKGVQGCHKAALLITGSAGSGVPHPATAPKDRSGRPEQGRRAAGKSSSSWKGNPRTDGRGPTVGEQRSGSGTCA